ncbi:MAG: crossover junction endodeoxyribonuclease [Dehalococcoidia bacterium]|nr:crossover junction endodeoxyribonuclease [Dehalococcoidia bacterium]
MTYVIGIDPGLEGAIVLLRDNQLKEVADMPTMAAGKHKRQVNAAQVRDILQGYVESADHEKIEIHLEQVSARPGQGVTSMFNFGVSYGIILGVAAALLIPVILCPAAKWKKRIGLLGSDKDMARTKAQMLYPDADLALKKDIGRADAILIARYGGE